MSNFKIPILMYHSIESMPKSTIMRSLHVKPKSFRFQMWILKLLGYKGLSMRLLKPYLNGKKKGKVIGITFDDGYQNNLLNAAPILKKYNFSATCYIVTEKIGLSNVWDSNKGITQRPLMNYREIREWLDIGMDIGSHSKSHSDLVKLSGEQLKIEITQSKTNLEDIFDLAIEDFCYPFGRFDNSTIDIVRDAGYFTATSMIRGSASVESNNFKLPRIPINYRTLPHLFIAKILTNYEEKRK